MTIKVKPSTEVYIVQDKGYHSNSAAKVENYTRATVHKQHKTGKVVLEAGASAKKYDPERPDNREWASWTARLVKKSEPWDRAGRNYIVPVDAKSTAYLTEQSAIIKREARARSAAGAIVKIAESMRHDGDNVEKLERALAILSEGEAP